MAEREPTRYEGVFEYATKKGDRRFLARWRDLNGRPCEKGGFYTAKAAKDHRMTVSAEKAAGVERDPAAERMTFATWTERWWAGKRHTIAPNTQAQYRTLLDRHVLPVLGGRRLRTLRRIDVEELVATLSAKPLSPSTVSTSRKLVGQVLQSAVDNGVIPTNVARGVKVARAPKSRVNALDVSQVELLAATVPPAYRVLVLVLAYGGLRPGEALALLREDVDELGRRLHVRATVSEVHGQLERRETTKTYQARPVELDEGLMAELRQHMRDRVLWSPDAPLFTTERGAPVRLSNFRDRVLSPAVKAAGLPSAWVTPYALRHTCASLLARNGVGVHVAARMMGHDPAEYLRTYTHLYDGDLTGAASALGRARAEALAEVIELPTDRAEGTRP